MGGDKSARMCANLVEMCANVHYLRTFDVSSGNLAAMREVILSNVSNGGWCRHPCQSRTSPPAGQPILDRICRIVQNRPFCRIQLMPPEGGMTAGAGGAAACGGEDWEQGRPRPCD